MSTLRHILRNNTGATAIEYGLVAALIAVVIISGLTALGSNLSNVFNFVGNSITTASA